MWFKVFYRFMDSKKKTHQKNSKVFFTKSSKMYKYQKSPRLARWVMKKEKKKCFRITEFKSYHKVKITKAAYHWCKNEHIVWTNKIT